MAVVNSTPEKDLTSCNAPEGAIFKVVVSGCNLVFQNLSSLSGITDIEYEVSLGGTVVNTVNTVLDTYTWIPASLYPDETLSIKQTITATAGTFENTLEYLTPPFADCYIVYSSNALAGDTVDPSAVDGLADSWWRFPDDVARSGAAQSHLGSDVGFDGTTQQVYYHCTNYSLLTSFSFKDDKVVGVPDLSILTDCTTFELDTNPGITDVQLPVPNSNIVVLSLLSCGLTGSFSVLNFGSKFAGNIFLEDNPLMTGAQFPTSSNDCDVRVNDCDITGTIDISMLTGITSFVADTNPNLTAITTGTHAQTWTTLWAYDCDLTGTLDLSGYTALAGDLRVYNNSNLTAITNPTSAGVFTVYRADNCGMTTWDGSNLSGLGGVFRLDDNSLTSVSNPTSSEVFTRIEIGDNSLTAWDISGLTAIESVVDAKNNNISTLTLPASSGTIDFLLLYGNALPYVDFTALTFSSALDIQLQDNAQVVSEVNCILVDLDTMLTGTITATINIAGTNAAPDGSSGGCSGTVAKTSLQGKGATVTTT